MGKEEEYQERESNVETDEEEEDDDDDEGEEKWRMHYSSRHRILLVGEGDFSFSLSLATHFGSARNMVATSLDSQEEIDSKYSNAIGNVRELEERGCIVIYGVDAKQMSQHFFLSTQRFDRIVYNFPHVGFLFREDSYCQIQLNKRLVKGFLQNAKLLLRKEGGEIHITHKEGHPYKQMGFSEESTQHRAASHSNSALPQRRLSRLRQQESSWYPFRCLFPPWRLHYLQVQAAALLIPPYF
ncbi:unnamed protein product [Prunus armeniaca]|uniref:25S rRNA (uridine-N(3))-methyltransferase BMT5-like domain-containing protein n=1 Tax=Prunus armeniaca TaxID=36596 RepID=A0A6J5X113_PRUAR|nr:unnamed protein product [Prunus armeniaca]